MDSTYPSGDVIKDLKTLRTEIDGAYNTALLTRQLSKPNETPNDKTDFGREVSLVITKLQEAKMWAGKCLEMIGNELPKEFQDKAE